MRALLLLIFIALVSCGQDQDTAPEKNETIISLGAEGPTLKKWGDGGIILHEEKLVLFTNYYPLGEMGEVSLAKCADLDPEFTVGKFSCHTDGSEIEIKAKHVRQICNLGLDQKVLEPAEKLTSPNCNSGNVFAIEFEQRFGHAIHHNE